MGWGKKISQNEARRLRKEHAALQRQRAQERSQWSREFVGGIHIATMHLARESKQGGKLELASQLGKALVAKFEGDQVRIFAV